MKKFLKYLLVAVAIIVVGVGVFLSYIAVKGIPTYEPEHVELTVEVTPERVAHGKKLSALLCNNCHYNDETKGLTGKFFADLPPEFGTIYSMNITQDRGVGIGAWTDGQLAYFLRTGIRPDGSYAPLYMPKFIHASDEDMASIIAFLRSNDPLVSSSQAEPPLSEPSFLVKFLCNVVFSPSKYPATPVPEPDTTNIVEHGKYLTTALYDCYTCHSADFTKLNIDQPHLSAGFLGGGNKVLNMEGNGLLSANITMDKETGIGNWSEEQFVKALRFGQTPTGSLRYPMIPYSLLTEQESKAIYAYLKTVPVIKNKVDKAIIVTEK